MTVDYRCVRYVTQPGSPVFTRAQYVVEDGVRGMQQTATDPLLSTRRAAPSDEQIVRDTLQQETGDEDG